MAEISYVPVMLLSLAEICEKLKVSKSTVKAWCKAGAPIIVEGEDKKRRYSCELMELHAWRKQHNPSH